MIPTSDKILTELVQIEGKGNEAEVQRLKRVYCNDEEIRIIMNNSDMTEEEAIFWSVGPSYARVHGVNGRAEQVLLWTQLSDRLDFESYCCDMEMFQINYHEAIVALHPPVKKHANHELGPREFTLTYSPDWFDDITAQFQMKRAIDRLCDYYQDDIVYLKAIGERTKAGRVHVHCMYELRGGLKFTDKNLKRAYPNWNGKHHHHKVIKDVASFKGYIEKEVEVAWMKKNIDNRT